MSNKVCPVPGWKGHFSPPSCTQERRNGLTPFSLFYFLCSPEAEIKQIQVSCSYFSAQPVETKCCKLSSRFQRPNNRHFFSTVTLTAHSRPVFGRTYCELGPSGGGGAGGPMRSLCQWPRSTAQQHGCPQASPELCKDSWKGPVVQRGFTRIRLRGSNKMSAEWHLWACGRMEEVREQENGENGDAKELL